MHPLATTAAAGHSSLNDGYFGGGETTATAITILRSGNPLTPDKLTTHT